MPECENCKAQSLPDSTFCEICGHKLGTPVAKRADPSEAKSGSLRSELAFLSGSLDQAKVRLDQWKQKGEQTRRVAEREAEQRQIEAQEAQQEKKKASPLRAVLQFMAGLVALAAFVYLLVRLPRQGSSLNRASLLLQWWKSLQSPKMLQ